jgi:hypothetical protein
MREGVKSQINDFTKKEIACQEGVKSQINDFTKKEIA